MILGNDYDRTLWLMIECNKDDRNNIIDLINEIPCELYERIRNSLYILNKYGNESGTSNLDYLHGNIIVDDRKYYYRIDNYKYCLILGRSKKEDNVYNEEIELCLNRISKDEIFKGYNLLVGSIQYNNGEIKKLCLGDKVRLWNFCRYVLVTNDFDDIENIDIVNVKNIPDIIDYSDLSNNKMLVRKRG